MYDKEGLIEMRNVICLSIIRLKKIRMTAVEFFILEQEGQQRKILEQLHDLFTSFPEITSKIRYRIPFYYHKSWICYLNPTKDGGIELAFTRGNELSNEQGLLESKGRKQVCGITFYQSKDIDEDLLAEIFQEALILDEQVPYASKRKTR